MANLKIKLVKSLNGRMHKHIATANSLGLRKIGDTTVQPDNAQTRGKIAADRLPARRSLRNSKEAQDMKLHELISRRRLQPSRHTARAAAHGSGNGKTAGRGHKGQRARSGGGVRVGF